METSNVKNMLDALKSLVLAYADGIIGAVGNYPSIEYINRVDSIFKKAQDALSAPIRNCDVGTPMEQAHRFHTFCIAHQCAIRGMCDPGCPMVENCTDMCQCICTWMQMPYEEDESDGRGI